MPRDLPSLKALRVFECAARHQNFSHAAVELFVTQGAVSRQIILLEQELGVKLFTRAGPRVKLNKTGAQYYRHVRDGLAVIRQGTMELKRQSLTPALTISVLPSFAAKWLVPRMTDFQQRTEGLVLRLAASYQLVNFDLEPDIDAAIRFGKGGYEGLYEECLINEQMFPVCSPRLFKSGPPIKTPEDLLKFPLLYTEEAFDEWPRWFEAAGLAPPSEALGLRYTDALMHIRAAVEGQGIILARTLMVADELETGQLIKPFDVQITSSNSYYFVCPKGREKETKIKAFLDWVRAEAGQTQAACEELTQNPVAQNKPAE